MCIRDSIYDEVRFAPQLHKRAGLTQRQAVEAVLEGRRQALAEHPDYDAGILLCAMCIGPETVNMEENLETVRLAKDFLGPVSYTHLDVYKRQVYAHVAVQPDRVFVHFASSP